MAWSSSDRRSRLPKDWRERVAAVKARACGRCEGIVLNGQPPWHVDACEGTGSECDHVIRGDDHSLSNLALLHKECHKRKTFLEKPKRQRPGRIHPGIK